MSDLRAKLKDEKRKRIDAETKVSMLEEALQQSPERVRVDALVTLLEVEVKTVEKKIRENKKRDLEDRIQINTDSELVDCLNYVIEHFKEKAK